jgi:hypothetical protein
VRRLPRILLNAATVVSLVLCVATVVLWVLSFWRLDQGHAVVGRQFFAANSARGRLVFYWYTDYVASTPLAWQSHALQPGPHLTGWSSTPPAWGFGAHHQEVTNAAGKFQISRDVLVPHWFLVLAAAALPTLRAGCRRRTRTGLCPVCAYDLRATPDRCPECGAVPKIPATNSN